MFKSQSERVAAIVFVVGITAAMIWLYLAVPAKEKFIVCNATPFDVGYVALRGRKDAAISSLATPNGGLSVLEPGKCEKHDIGRPKVGDVYYAYASTELFEQHASQNQRLLQYVYNHVTDDRKNVIWQGEDLRICLPLAMDGHFSISNSKTSACRKQHLAVGLKKISRTEKKNGNIYNILVAPDLGTVDIANLEDSTTIEAEIGRNAKGLRKVIERHVAFIEKWSGHEVPFHLGADVNDDNGPLSIGLQISNATSKSIFGDDLPLQAGDILYRINDIDVFTSYDVSQALIEHGFRYDKGITEPIEVIFARGNEVFRAKMSYFFNENYYLWSGDRTNDAVYYGVLDAISLGFAAEANCVGRNTPAFINNSLGAVLEMFNSSVTIQKLGYDDWDICIWRAETEIALAKQKENEIYTRATWVIVAISSAPRALIQGSLRYGVRRVAGRAAASNLLTDVALSLVETGFFFLNTKSPLQSYADVTDEYIHSLPNVAGISLAVGIIKRGR